MSAASKWAPIFAVAWLAACSRPVLASLDKAGEGYVISLPNARAKLEFSEPGYDVQVSDPHRPYYVLSNERTGVELSFVFERATECTNSHECRDLAAERLRQIKPDTKIQNDEIENVSISEYTDPPHGGINLRQRHVHAHFVGHGQWVHAHFSKVDYQDSDRELFVRAVRAIRLSPL